MHAVADPASVGIRSDEEEEVSRPFSETDQTEDLKAITVPTLVTQGDDDQVVPYKGAVELQAKLIKNSTLKIYKGFPHGMPTTHADVINPDLLAFVKG
jgi:non-heme chloroperoxidase